MSKAQVVSELGSSCVITEVLACSDCNHPGAGWSFARICQGIRDCAVSSIRCLGGRLRSGKRSWGFQRSITDLQPVLWWMANRGSCTGGTIYPHHS
jgi:hypothetical protein